MRIAVVIPALDEAGSIEAAVASARATGDAKAIDLQGADPEGPEGEVIVVDGGSRDSTADRARAAGARVRSAPRGRALQLEVGWRDAKADAVVFLHADTRLPSGWAGAVRDALADPAVAGGAFALRFDRRTPGLRVIEWGAHWRVRLLGLAYGDQAIFARRAALEAAGGIAPVPIFEDLDLVRALRRRGRFALLRQPVTTSARRYLRRGLLRTWLRNALALAAWRLGVDRRRVASWYAG